MLRLRDEQKHRLAAEETYLHRSCSHSRRASRTREPIFGPTEIRDAVCDAFAEFESKRAKSTPKNSVFKPTTQEHNQEVTKICVDLPQSFAENVTSSVTHLSLPKGIDAGSKERFAELLTLEDHIMHKEQNQEDFIDELHNNNSRSFPLIRDKEHHTVFDPGALIETFTYEQGKEIVVSNATIQRYAILPFPHAKLMDLEYTKRQYHLNEHFKNMFASSVCLFASSSYVLLHQFVVSLCYAFIRIIASRREFEHDMFFRHGGFLFEEDEMHEPNRNYVLMNFNRLSKTASTSPNVASFFGKAIYFDSTLNYNKPLEDHAEHLKFVLDDLSGHLFASRDEYIFYTYDPLSRVFAVSKQAKRDIELEYLTREQQENMRQCRLVFEPGGCMGNNMRRTLNQIKNKLMPRIVGQFTNIQRTRDNAKQHGPQGKYNLIPFNASNLVPFLADVPDLRTNPFQEEGDDMIMDGNEDQEDKEDQEELKDEQLGTLEHGVKDLGIENLEFREPLHIPTGPMTRARSQRLNKSVAGLLQATTDQSHSLLHEGREKIIPHWL